MADKRSKTTKGGKKKGKTAKAQGPEVNAENASVEPVCPVKEVASNESTEPACCQAEKSEPQCGAEPSPCSPAETVEDNPAAEEEQSSSGRKITKQHHVSSILDRVLEEEIPDDPNAGTSPRFRYPICVDALLGIGLLVAVAGFTIGLFKMYVTHQAQQHIMQGDYKTAIRVLEATPMPPMFSMDGASPEETLAQAHYLDALQKFQTGNNSDAFSELQKIRPGSRYFDQSQRLLSENYVPSETILQCGVTTEDQPVQASNQQ